MGGTIDNVRDAEASLVRHCVAIGRDEREIERTTGTGTVVIRDSGSGAPVESIGFAIAIDSIKPLIDRLEAGKPPLGQPFIGVAAADLTPQLKADLGVTVDKGAVVQDVTAGSPSWRPAFSLGDPAVTSCTTAPLSTVTPRSALSWGVRSAAATPMKG